MLDPNSGKVQSSSNYEAVEKVLKQLTPKPESFGGSIYEIEEVRRDEEELEYVKSRPDYSQNDERSDAKILEKTFIEMAETDDWFGEWDLYADDPEFHALINFPTAEIDDHFNHIDLIGVINNELTGHEALPFAIDLTYNANRAKIRDKFNWTHIYGKKPGTTENVSEFDRRYFPKEKPDLRCGLNVPGFASAKYFEDLNAPWDPAYEKGRIKIMPRFVVGYSKELSDALSRGAPSDEYRLHYGKQAYDKETQDYQNARLRAKWCTLFECSKQACEIRQMLANLSEEETRRMDPVELETAKKQIAVMDRYFMKAIKVAKEHAENNQLEKDAMQYASRDAAYNVIEDQSESTYVRKDWQTL